jgi:hypothetical protein
MSATPEREFSWDDGWEHADDEHDAADGQPGEPWHEEWDDEGWTELAVVDGREGRAEWMSWVGQLVLVGLLLPLVLVLLAALLIVLL